MNKMQYETKEYNATRAFYSLLIAYPGTLILWIVLGRWLGIPAIIVTIIFMFMFVLPMFFKKRIMALFTSKALLEMEKDSFSVLYLNSEGNVVKERKIYWDTIQSYSFYLGEKTPTITALTLHFKKGLPKSFNFVDKQFEDTKSFNEMLKGECLLTFFCNQVKQYNTGRLESDQIHLSPGFFASKTGLISIYLITLLVILAIIFHLIVAPKSSFATLLISVGLLTGFVSKRQRLLELYKKISELVN